MNRRPFVRTLIYLGLIVALLVPLSFLSQPATVAARSEPASAGGLMARLRKKHDLGQAELGEIDPTSETIRLATLGLRPVATWMLWERGIEFQKKEDWTSFQIVLDQLAKLQPNYVSVWRYQAWNVSYNISAEWDDYRDRYFWVKEGIKYLEKGTRYNQSEPRLLYDTGWFTGLKFGMSDERVQFRKLFRDDTDDVYPNHGGKNRPVNARDNWLVGREYFLAAQHLVDNLGASLGAMNPLTFYSEPAKCLINYAASMEMEGTFGEKAREAWENAWRAWEEDYGSRELPGKLDTVVRLNDLEMLQEKASRLRTQFDEFRLNDTGTLLDIRKQLEAEKRAKLSPSEQAALGTPVEERTGDEQQAAESAASKTHVANYEVATRVQGPQAEKVRQMAVELFEIDRLVDATAYSREVVNFDYWKMRCRMDKTEDALRGRELLHKANLAFTDADLILARQAFEEAFVCWRRVMDEFPIMVYDQIGEDVIGEALKGYGMVLKQLDEPFPDSADFVLQEAINARRPKYKAPAGMAIDPLGIEQDE